MYPPHHLGGYELMWEAAVEALRARGHQVRVLSSDFEQAGVRGGDDQVSRELRWYWRDHRFPRLSLRERLAIERHNLACLERHLHELRPQLVSFWAMGGMSMSLVERVARTGPAALANVHEDWMLYGPRADGWQRAFGRAPTARITELVTRVPTVVRLDDRILWLFNSETTRRSALTRWPLARTRVITPGVDLDLFEPAKAKPWSDRLLYVGRIDPRKGILTAIEALAHLPTVRLRIVGGGDERYLEELRGAATALGLADRVELASVARRELAREYANADAVLFPVRWEEPWGLVPLEAMAVGTPVVASGRGGSAEYLRDLRNCSLYAPAESPEALAEAVRRLAADDELRRRLREGGFETAQDHGRAAFEQRIVAAHEDTAQ
jgi:glycosyltransferase involved in cell wall biosynthesis